MLTNASEILTMIPVKDFDRAAAFYTDVLGLSPTSNVEGMPPLYQTAHGHKFLLYVPNEASTATHTLATFMVDDIHAIVSSLKGKGVSFEHVAIPNMGAETDENGILTLPTGKAAWFKDTEGNTIGISMM